MSTQNNDLWEGLKSNFFSEVGEEGMSDIPRASDVRPSVADTRQILDILFIIDVSGSMKGSRIAQVNYALENIFKEMRSREDLHSRVKIGIMEFSDRAVWKTDTPIDLDDYVFTQINAQSWYTCYSAAFTALEKKLHSSEFMNPALGTFYAPLILFVTDGEPVDVDDYPAALQKLKQNKWFRKSAKYAIAVGEEARTPEVARLLTQFTDLPENVRFADEGAALCQLIQFIAVRASEVQSSMVTGTEGGSIFNEPDSGWSSMFSKSQYSQ